MHMSAPDKEGNPICVRSGEKYGGNGICTKKCGHVRKII